MSRFDSALLQRALEFVGAVELPVLDVDPIDLVVQLCIRFEGFYSKPYICPAGVPTIGYGATYYLDGRAVLLTDPPISEPAARQLLRKTIERDFAPAVRKLCPGRMSAGQFAALVDFAFNLGSGRLKGSTLRIRVNEGDWDRAQLEFMKWVYGGGRPLRGLVLRRQAEVAIT